MVTPIVFSRSGMYLFREFPGDEIPCTTPGISPEAGADLPEVKPEIL